MRDQREFDACVRDRSIEIVDLGEHLFEFAVTRRFVHGFGDAERPMCADVGKPCVPTSRETPQHWKLVTRAGENMRHDEVQDRRPSAEP